jgi:uncharacterized Fe-S cluster protein YjdI
MERKITKKYTNGEVTVVWQPHACVHSSVCWKGLLSVFNPSVKPWINMDGANSEQIIEQVQQCPSGALSYYMNHENSGKNAEQEDVL